MKALALLVYERLTGDVVTNEDQRRGAITAEMKAVLAAPDVESAAKVIGWWRWERGHEEAVEFVTLARKMYRVMRRRPARRSKAHLVDIRNGVK